MNDFLLLFCDLYIKEKFHNKFVSSACIFDFLSKKISIIPKTFSVSFKMSPMLLFDCKYRFLISKEET